MKVEERKHIIIYLIYQLHNNCNACDSMIKIIFIFLC